jgi:hypothetical protein
LIIGSDGGTTDKGSEESLFGVMRARTTAVVFLQIIFCPKASLLADYPLGSKTINTKTSYLIPMFLFEYIGCSFFYTSNGIIVKILFDLFLFHLILFDFI